MGTAKFSITDAPSFGSSPVGASSIDASSIGAAAIEDVLFAALDLREPTPIAIGSGDIDRAVSQREPTDLTKLNEVLALVPDQADRGISVESDPETGFAGALAVLWKQSANGTLRVSASDVRTTIYLREGVPIFAERGGRGQALGSMLVRIGKITEEQLLQVILRMTEHVSENEELRFGEALVELGILPPQEVHEALRMQTREKLLACFHWERVEARFEDGGEFLEAICRFPAPVPPLVLFGIRQFWAPDRLEKFLGPHGDLYPVLIPENTIVERMELGPSDRKFLVGISGNQNLASLQHDGALDRIAAGQLLAALLVLEAAELRTARRVTPPRRPSSSTGAAPVLASSGGSSGSGSLGPSAAPGTPGGPSTQDTPVAPGSHAAPAASAVLDKDRRLQAEMRFIKAKGLIAQSQHHAAIPLLAQAMELDPEVAEYRLFHTYEEYLVCRDPEVSKALAEKAVELATKVTQQGRTCARAFTILGHFQWQRGMVEVARDHFRRALAVNPKDHEAARELRLLEKREGGPGAGGGRAAPRKKRP